MHYKLKFYLKNTHPHIFEIYEERSCFVEAVIMNFESGSKTNIQMSIQRLYNVNTITSVASVIILTFSVC